MTKKAGMSLAASTAIIMTVLAVFCGDARAEDQVKPNPAADNAGSKCDPGGKDRTLGAARLFIPSLFDMSEVVSYVSLNTGGYYDIVSRFEISGQVINGVRTAGFDYNLSGGVAAAEHFGVDVELDGYGSVGLNADSLASMGVMYSLSANLILKYEVLEDLQKGRVITLALDGGYFFGHEVSPIRTLSEPGEDFNLLIKVEGYRVAPTLLAAVALSPMLSLQFLFNLEVSYTTNKLAAKRWYLSELGTSLGAALTVDFLKWVPLALMLEYRLDWVFWTHGAGYAGNTLSAGLYYSRNNAAQIGVYASSSFYPNSTSITGGIAFRYFF